MSTTLRISSTGQEFEIRDGAVVGRHESCQIRLNSRTVSRRHAQFTFREDVLFIEDLGSTNGTFICFGAGSSVPIDGPTPLHVDCLVAFGTECSTITIGTRGTRDPFDLSPATQNSVQQTGLLSKLDWQSQLSNSPFEQLGKVALQLKREGRYQEALETISLLLERMPEHHPERPRHYRGLGKILLGTSDFRGAAGAFACDLDFTACCSALDLNSLFWLGASLIGDLAFGHKQAGLDKLVKLSGHQLELVQDQVQQISAMRSVASDVKIGLSRSALSDDALEAISGTWQGEELVFNRKLELFREELPPELSLLLWGNRATDEITLFALIYLVALVFAADFQFRFHSVGQMEAALIGQIPVPLGRRLSEAEVARLNQWIFAGGVPGGQAGRLALRPDTACFEEVVPVQDLYWRIEASSGGLLRSRSRVYANVGPVNSIVEDTNVSDYELELVFPAETRSQGVPAGRSIEDGQLIQLITIPSVPILVIGSSLTSG